MRSTALVLLVLLCILHCCAGVTTSLKSVATSFEQSCERLPCGKRFFTSLAMHRLLNALWRLSSSSVVCSKSATLDLATALLRWNRAATCSGPYCGSHLASYAPVFGSVHYSRCSGVAFLLARQRSCPCTAAVKLQCSAAPSGRSC